MKKILLYLGAVFILSNTFAQKGFQIGGNFTPGLSYMLAQNNYFLAPGASGGDSKSSKELDYKAKFSFNSGLFFGYNISEKHGIRINAGYNVEGQKYQDDFKWPIYGLQGRHTKEVNFQFINTGVSYRFSPILKGQKEKNPNGNYANGQYKIRMRIMAGLETDILINANMKYNIRRFTRDEFIQLGLNPDKAPPYFDQSPAPDFSQYPYIQSGSPIGHPSYQPAAPFGNGGYAPYYALGKPASQKDYFVPIQAALTLNYGFDYILKNNMYFGLGLDFKVGLNDINAKPYRTHPEYKKSKNYFFGLKAEIGYNILKNEKKTPKIKTPSVQQKEAKEEPNPKDSIKQSKEIGEKAYTKYTKGGQRKDVNIKKLNSKKKKKK